MSTQAPGSVYLSSPKAFTHAVGHRDLERWEKLSDSEFRSMLMETVRGMAMISEDDPKTSKNIFRDSRIVAVQCRVSAPEIRIMMLKNAFSDRDDSR